VPSDGVAGGAGRGGCCHHHAETPAVQSMTTLFRRRRGAHGRRRRRGRGRARAEGNCCPRYIAPPRRTMSVAPQSGAGDVEIAPGRDWLSAHAPKAGVKTCLGTHMHRCMPVIRGGVKGDGRHNVGEYGARRNVLASRPTVRCARRSSRFFPRQSRFPKTRQHQSADATTLLFVILCAGYVIDLAPVNSKKSTQTAFRAGLECHQKL
jgi:hypothetical protein